MAQYHHRNLRKKTVFRDEEISKFDREEKLDTNENMAKKAAFDIKTKFCQKQMSGEQSNKIKCKLKSLKESELSITPSCADNHKLIEVNECLAKQLKILQRNEHRHIADIEKLEMSKNNLEIELCNVYNRLREKGHEVEKLTDQLMADQKGSRRIRNEPEEGQTALDWLEDWCRDLKTDAATAEAKLKEYRASRRPETDSGDVKSRRDEKAERVGQKPRETDACGGLLEREADVLMAQGAELRAARQDDVADAVALRTRAEAAEGLLEIAKRSLVARNRAREEARDRLRRKNAELTGENAELTREKAELEDRLRRLRDEVRRGGRPEDSGQSGVVGTVSTCSWPVDGDGGSAGFHNGIFDRLKRMCRGPRRAPDEHRESK